MPYAGYTSDDLVRELLQGVPVHWTAMTFTVSLSAHWMLLCVSVAHAMIGVFVCRVPRLQPEYTVLHCLHTTCWSVASADCGQARYGLSHFYSVFCPVQPWTMVSYIADIILLTVESFKSSCIRNLLVQKHCWISYSNFQAHHTIIFISIVKCTVGECFAWHKVVWGYLLCTWEKNFCWCALLLWAFATRFCLLCLCFTRCRKPCGG